VGWKLWANTLGEQQPKFWEEERGEVCMKMNGDAKTGYCKDKVHEVTQSSIPFPTSVGLCILYPPRKPVISRITAALVRKHVKI
jgi:hypothetical protein